MFKFLFRTPQSVIKKELQRYVDMEYAPQDRAAAFEKLLREAIR
jgi:hypothetical protein